MTIDSATAIPGVARTFRVAASRSIAAPPADVYRVFADYREAHPKILPPSFFVGLEVREGGYGDGTVIDVAGRFAGRTRVIRGVVTEPEPGRLLVESYPAERMVTSFRVEPEGEAASRVTITTRMRRRRGPLGWLEERLVRRLLVPVFEDELRRVAAYLGVPADAPLAS